MLIYYEHATVYGISQSIVLVYDLDDCGIDKIKIYGIYRYGWTGGDIIRLSILRYKILILV